MSALIPVRAPDAHKGTFGHLAVAAGARGFTGAAMLTAHAALRSGPGLVSLALPEPCVASLAPALIECMTRPLSATETASFHADAADELLDFLDGKDALALGPGITQHPGTAQFVRLVLAKAPLPLVLDADGLNVIAGRPEALEVNPGPRVITPHPGEMARLAETDTRNILRDREHYAATFAERHGCIVVLKGHATLIASPDGDVLVNPTGNPGMAAGGAGDVLTGIIGALLAQGLTPKDAACLGVYAHGLAGDIAAQAYTQMAMTAGDIIDALPDAWAELGAP